MTWKVSEEVVKSNPLFSCETYEVYGTSVMGVILRFGAYAGHIIEFKVIFFFFYIYFHEVSYFVY